MTYELTISDPVDGTVVRRLQPANMRQVDNAIADWTAKGYVYALTSDGVALGEREMAYRRWRWL